MQKTPFLTSEYFPSHFLTAAHWSGYIMLIVCGTPRIFHNEQVFLSTGLVPHVGKLLKADVIATYTYLIRPTVSACCLLHLDIIQYTLLILSRWSSLEGGGGGGSSVWNSLDHWLFRPIWHVYYHAYFKVLWFLMFFMVFFLWLALGTEWTILDADWCIHESVWLFIPMISGWSLSMRLHICQYVPVHVL